MATTKKPSKRRIKSDVKSLFTVSCDPNHKIEPVNIPYNFPEKTFTPREYQKPAINWICDRYSQGHAVSGLILSTGAGKSKASSFAVAEVLKKELSTKAIIAVPQEVIGESWRHDGDIETSNFLTGRQNWLKSDSFPKKDIISWSLAVDLCQSAGTACISENGKVKELIKFLKSPAAPSVHSRILLVTHATLALTYKELKRTKQLNLLSNLFLVIDEFHHIFVDDKQDNCNSIGELIYYILDNKKQLKTHLCCLTATFFRGDRRRIFSGKFSAMIENAFFELPFDEYFRHLKYLEELRYDFGIFSANEGFDKPIANCIRKNGLGKSIFFIPARTKGESSLFSVGNKKKDVEMALLGIAKGKGWKYGVEKRPYTLADGTQNEAIFQLRVGKDEWIIVVDAVDDDDHIRNGVKKFLRQVNKGKDNVDVIIALGMCKEGFDWIACDRVILLGNIKSLASIVQINGRMIRDVIGKRFAAMTWLLPTTVEVDQKSVTEDLNQALLSLHLALMMCIDMMQPIRVMAPKKDNPKEQEEISGGDLLSELFETMDRRLEFLTMVSAKISREGRPVTFEERLNIVSDILLDLNVSEENVSLYAESVATYTLRRAAAVAANKSIRLSIDFDSPLVREMTKRFKLVSPEELPPEGFIAIFAAQAIGVPSFKVLREAVTEISNSFSDQELSEFEIQINRFCKKYGRPPNINSDNIAEKELAIKYLRWTRKITPFAREKELV